MVPPATVLPTWHRRVPTHAEMQSPVPIMPKPLHARPAPIRPATVIKRPRLETSPPRTVSPTSPTRRRAPALERLPRWLFQPVRRFVSPPGELPLPQKVAVHGKPFYDWDAWAISLLSPKLWRRRGPWERLVRSCHFRRPADVPSPDDMNAALVRIIVAEVVSQLVSRCGENLTPEDRNWITSVASRQKGRDPRKPTLMLLLDFAFPLFDLCSYCRLPRDAIASADVVQSHVTDVSESDDAEEDTQEVMSVYKRLMNITNEHVVRLAGGKSSPMSTKYAETPSEEAAEYNPAMDAIVENVLQLINTSQTACEGSNSTECIQHVTRALQKLLTELGATRWNARCSSSSEVRMKALSKAASAFVHALPLHRCQYPLTLTDEQVLSTWLCDSTKTTNWDAWAQLANDFSYISSATDDTDSAIRTLLCENIAMQLLANDSKNDAECVQKACFEGNGATKSCHVGKTRDLSKTEHAGRVNASNMSLTIRLIVDVVINLENFLSCFIDTYNNDAVELRDVTWTVLSFEALVQGLSLWRNVLLAIGNQREKEMIGWSTRSVQLASYYQKTVSGSSYMREDVNRAIQSAFSEASWSAQMRTMRYMTPLSQHCKVDSSTDGETQGREGENTVHRPWVLGLNLANVLNMAIVIVLWDPRRALRLLDESIGLTEEGKQDVVEGKEGLPLWDYRRIAVCKFLMQRGNVTEAVLAMERLQPLFNMKWLHDGGNFSAKSVKILRAEVNAGNFCAQTTLGLLLAGDGEYWDVARWWTQTERSMAQGCMLLNSSARTGDLEACTGLSHLWAHHGMTGGMDMAMGNTSFDEIVTLFKTAVMSQNANGVLNLGVLWRYGVDGVMSQNETVAIDSFLIGLQGAISSETRDMAVQHICECFRDDRGQLVRALNELDCASTWQNNTITTARPILN